MTTPLLEARLRLKWAEDQISDFDRAIQSFFARKPYRVVIDVNSKPGRILHRVNLIELIPDDWKRHVTRIVSDLRDPLDYATVAVGKSLKAEKAEILCMPIEDTKQAFEREMKNRKIERRCPQLA
jgi:hypothetical protein